MINNSKDLDKMIKNIYNNNNKIIGIDVEHYNKNNIQKFICCIQISTCSGVYILDIFGL